MTDSDNPDPQWDDPFFRLPNDSEWNACIGRQGDEENYVDGYIEAAIELAGAVIDKKMYGSRDTLVMPILYNTRHAIELALKFAIIKFREMGVISKPLSKNHKIMSHWELLNTSALGDKAATDCVMALESFVVSLSQIDDDGQELRYSENRDGRKSLADHSLANIEVIREGLDRLGELTGRLKFRIIDLIEERSTGSYTKECSRRDLLTIAKTLPDRSEWRQPEFAEAKRRVMKRFNISGKKFADTVDVIESNREMRSLIGQKTNLAHLSDENVVFAVEQWARRHCVVPSGNVLGIDSLTEYDADAVAEYRRIALDANNEIVEALAPDEIVDLQVIFYIGRDGPYCEYYEQMIESTRKEHRAAEDLAIKVNHIMQKTNFREAVSRGVAMLGRPDLEDRLRGIDPRAALT